jgi:hypothetical protein
MSDVHVYVNNEVGPDCSCGEPTIVKFVNGSPLLVCFFHSGPAGSYNKLPPITEENWQRLMADSAIERPDDD